MSSDEPEELEHVLLNVNDDMYGGVATERVWAKPLGNDLYEIRNTPWHTCEVGWGDVVLAKSDAPDHWPTMIKVVRSGGHRTLHIYFQKPSDEEKRDSVLRELKKWKANYENADSKLYAIDVNPEGDFRGLVEYLEGMKAKGVLDFRTVVDADESGA
jgi:uncharacterized protein DUF4265